MKSKSSLFLAVRLSTYVAGVAAVLAGLLLLWDTAGVALSESVASDYYLGSESMIAHGGWAYRSRTNYVISGLGTSAGFIGAGAAFCVLGRRRTQTRRGA